MSLEATVRLHYADAVTRELTVRAGQTVLEAGLQAGLPLLHQCQSGSCGACGATLLSGEVATRAGAGSTVLPAEWARGLRLLCQSEAATTCEFQLSYASEDAQATPRRCHAFVNSVETLAQDVVRLTLELAQDDWLDFRPGQYLRIKVPGTDTWRSYSPSSTPHAVPQLSFLLRVIDGGAMSTWLTQRCRVDDVLELEGPFGQFFLREKTRAPHIFLAGGTGLAPTLSMLDAIRRQGGIKPPLLVAFGCRSPAALFGTEELALFQQWLPTLEVRTAVEQATPPGCIAGTPLSALRPEDFAHPEAVIYVCGPPAMVEAAHALLSNWGVSPSRIHSEQFAPSAARE
jgi:benzoate/toluate 1,2-dioxygenase reductase subunit